MIHCRSVALVWLIVLLLLLLVHVFSVNFKFNGLSEWTLPRIHSKWVVIGFEINFHDSICCGVVDSGFCDSIVPWQCKSLVFLMELTYPNLISWPCPTCAPLESSAFDQRRFWLVAKWNLFIFTKYSFVYSFECSIDLNRQATKGFVYSSRHKH